MTHTIGFDAVVDHFTLATEQREALRNKTGATRLGFALMWRFLLWRGRFPRGRSELPDDAVEHVAHQVDVSASELASYDPMSRQASNHRGEIRRRSGFRPATVADADKLAAWIADGPARSERRGEPLRAMLLAHCRDQLLEPPTADRLTRIVDSGTRQAEKAQIALVVSRLGNDHIARLETLVELGGSTPSTLVTAADDQGADDAAGEDEPGEEMDVLSAIRASPGNVSLASMLTEINKLEATRAIDLPADLFRGISGKVLAAWRAQAAIESPSHLRAHEQPVRLVLLSALVHLRRREITDTLVELLNSVIHKINAHADKSVTEAFVRQYKRLRNTDTLLGQVAEASLQAPEKAVQEVIYPVLGGTAGLTDLLREYKARQGAYARDKRRVFRASYSNHYRTGLIKLLATLQFRSNNTAHRPVLDGLGLILRYAEAKTTYYPPGEHVVLDGVVRPEWMEFTLATDNRGRTRVVRQVYECCVLIALRERLRCKEIWVLGADTWRNPDEDLPADFEDNRAQHYRELHLPREATEFTTSLRTELTSELDALHQALPRCSWLQIQPGRLAGPIKLTPLDKQPEPANLRTLKHAIVDRWGTVPLIDMLKEAALRTGMLASLAPAGGRGNLSEAVLYERLLLCLYAYGTNSGLRTVAAGGHEHSEAELRYVARRYLTPAGLKAATAAIANATFTARQQAIWGEGTTTVASDSTHFAAYDRNIFTEWHSRYGGRGVLVYWSVESGAMAIHSQLITCTASEVAAMIEGVMRHGTSMRVEGNYVDTHGQSEIGFGITRLLGFDLLPRIKQINRVKLYRPAAGNPHAWPGLEAALTRPIRWDLIERNYDMLVKYATAIRVGTASTEAILRRFTRNASHPVYQAMLELGRAQKTIFIARYLRDRELQREINSGLNVVESWNGVNDVIFFGKNGELASNRRDQQELAVLCLHVLQAALVYVNTLMIQDQLAEPDWADTLTTEDRRGLNPLFTSNMTPYGEVRLDMNSRLDLATGTQSEPNTSE